MGEEHRLRPLQMGIAGHDDVPVRLCQVEKGFLQSDKLLYGLSDGFSGEEAHVQRNLVISGAGGVELLTYIANLLDKPCFDVHMDIFQVSPKSKFALFNLLADGGKPHHHKLGVLIADDALLCQHTGMGD